LGRHKSDVILNSAKDSKNSFGFASNDSRPRPDAAQAAFPPAPRAFGFPQKSVRLTGRFPPAARAVFPGIVPTGRAERGLFVSFDAKPAILPKPSLQEPCKRACF
jgi:hypothetical protein